MLVEFEEQKPEVVMVGHDDAICAMAIGFDNHIVTGGRDSSVRLWHPTSGRARPVRTFIGHDDWVSCVYVDKSRIISGGGDDFVKLYDPRQPKATTTLSCSSGGVRCLKVGGLFDHIVVAGAGDGHLCGWDLRFASSEKTQRLFCIKVHEGAVQCMDGDRLQVVSGGEDGIVCAIDPCTGDTLLRSAVHEHAITSLYCDGHMIVSSSYDAKVGVVMPRGV